MSFKSVLILMVLVFGAPLYLLAQFAQSAGLGG